MGNNTRLATKYRPFSANENNYKGKQRNKNNRGEEKKTDEQQIYEIIGLDDKRIIFSKINYPHRIDRIYTILCILAEQWTHIAH